MSPRNLTLPLAVLVLTFAAAPVRAADRPAPGQVTLGLAQYLALVEAAEARDKARLVAVDGPSAWIARQESLLTLEGDGARLTTRFDVEARGSWPPPVLLPWPILAETVTLEPAAGASLTRLANGGSALVATGPGSWRVTVTGDARSREEPGIRRLDLPAATAPFAAVQVELAADLAWSAPGAVVTADAVTDGRRRLDLAPPRGGPVVFEVSRRSVASAPEEALVRTMVVTLVELGSESARRHDVVLYEVLRGQLGRLEVDLPPGRTDDLVATDEGDAVPVAAEAGHLVVERKRQLTGEGWLVLTSTESLPREGASLPLDPIVPTAEVKARYLVLAAGLAAEVAPRPKAAWQQVDLSDLPAGLRQRVGEVEPAAVWRLSGPATAPALAVHPLPAAELARGLVRSRETTSLLSLDGTLLHRERLLVATGAPAVALTLPAGATFWSAQVDGKSVRPVERDGRLLVPLPARSQGARSEVEVISVQPKKLERTRRSHLGLELAEVDLPVLRHRWRLLLPEGYRYRVAGGDLAAVPDPGERKAQAAGNESRQESIYISPGRNDDNSTWAVDGVTITDMGAIGNSPGYYDFDSFEEMEVKTGRADVASAVAGVEMDKVPTARDPWLIQQQSGGVLVDRVNVGKSLAKGVQPLPIQIPETGRVIHLAGALPPGKVTLELEVKTVK
ncbi:MAG TPA: hypothetical protein VF017_00265 [Thermoanaerobaculia bacterium]|nr:hypothetical protein [Thermoanaerobaculia bacterium]